MRSFTLLELIIVIIIISIIASFALPNYFKTKERALTKEPIANLVLIRSAERLYQLERGSFIDCRCSVSGTGVDGCNNAATGCNTLLKLSLNPSNWLYNVSGSSTSAFQAVAWRQSSPYDDCIYTIDNSMPEPSPAIPRLCP